jgi:hypothetical protein
MMFKEGRRGLCTHVPQVSCTSARNPPHSSIPQKTQEIDFQSDEPNPKCQMPIPGLVAGETRGLNYNNRREIRTPLENAWRSSQSPRSSPSLIRATTEVVNERYRTDVRWVLLLVLEATTPASRLVPLACCPLQMVAKERSSPSIVLLTKLDSHFLFSRDMGNLPVSVKISRPKPRNARLILANSSPREPRSVKCHAQKPSSILANCANRSGSGSG